MGLRVHDDLDERRLQLRARAGHDRAVRLLQAPRPGGVFRAKAILPSGIMVNREDDSYTRPIVLTYTLTVTPPP